MLKILDIFLETRGLATLLLSEVGGSIVYFLLYSVLKQVNVVPITLRLSWLKFCGTYFIGSSLSLCSDKFFLRKSGWPKTGVPKAPLQGVNLNLMGAKCILLLASWDLGGSYKYLLFIIIN